MTKSPAIDASPLIFLSKAGLIELLQILSGEIIVPQAVARENWAIALGQIISKLQLSVGEVFNAIQSLKMRLLLESIQEDNLTLFVLNPVWKQYGLTR